MNKIIQDRVIRVSTEPLTPSDLQKMQTRKIKLLRFFLLAYVPFALILLYVFLNGIEVIERHGDEMNDEDVERFHAVVPYVCGFFFLVLTGYFFKLYWQSLRPILIDIRKKEKQLLHFSVEKTDMSAFQKFYITSPIRNQQQIQIDKEDFYSIKEQELLSLEIGPASCIVLGLFQSGRSIGLIDSIKY